MSNEILRTVGTERVVIRRHWSGAEIAEASLEALWGIHIRNQPGGVCRALPRAFMFAHIWCDKLAGGALGHSCRHEPPPPHELLVCILPADNSVALYERLCAIAKG
jgi:hypothetical protein